LGATGVGGLSLWGRVWHLDLQTSLETGPGTSWLVDSLVLLFFFFFSVFLEGLVPLNPNSIDVF
jgi:hypothetical protein